MACNSNRDWTYLGNQFGDGPCVIAQKVLQNFEPQCPGGGDPGHLPQPAGQYSIPTRGSSNFRCQCSGAYYYAVSACALCQGATDYPTWDAWTSNCGTAVKLPPYNDQLRSVLPSYALGTPSGGSKFVDPRAPNNPPPPQTPPPPITPTPPPGPTTTSVPTSKPNDDDDTTSASNSSSGSLSGSSSGSSVSSTATNTDSSTDSSTSTLTSPASSRPSGGGVATGTAGFSADPNDPNNPSPSISPLDGSSNSGNGALAERKGNNAGAIVGGVIGAIAFLILLGGAIYWFRTRRRRGSLAPSAAYMAAYGRPETVMSQRPYTDRSNTPLHSIYPEAHSPYSDDLRESVHSYNMEGVTGYNGPQRNISPQQYSPTR